MFVMASSFQVFKEVYQRTNFSQITYRSKASSGMEGQRLHVVWGLTGILAMESLAKKSLKPSDPQLVVPYILPTMNLGSKFTKY